uniref:Uncharacterized protein n=2 Tax=Ditylenchus dipsaci TaxID=166011 RepID=A0A915DJN1_9BILA
MNWFNYRNWIFFLDRKFSSTSLSLDGEGYKKLVEDVLKLLQTHLEKTTNLLQNQDLLPEEVSESVRVAVGRTELLLKKRMAQFTKQLHSHLNPATADKLTTLNDLHGLWTLVDIQLADIRNCFEQVEKSRLIGWQTPRQTLTTAASMPSLLLPPTSRRPSTENGHKVLLPKPLGLKNVDSAANKEKELQRKAVIEAKRQELNRQRRALIDAKRAELNNQKEELVIDKE